MKGSKRMEFTLSVPQIKMKSERLLLRIVLLRIARPLVFGTTGWAIHRIEFYKKMISSITIEDNLCETYTLAKMCRLSFPVFTSCIEDVFDLLHSKVWEPATA